MVYKKSGEIRIYNRNAGLLMGVGTNLIVSSFRSLAHLTEVKSNIILKATSMTITPAILMSSPFVDNQKTKNYVAVKHVIGAILGLGINLLVSAPVTKALDNWAKAGTIPYLPGSKQLAALKLVTGGVAVALTIPPTVYLVNKILPGVMKYIYPENKNNTTETKEAIKPQLTQNKKNNRNWLA